jgi:hypothetical protein
MPHSELSKEDILVDITVHIFSVSATLVGACLTVISLFIISRSLNNVRRIGESLLALDAVIFLFSCGIAYTALSMRKKKRQHKLEKVAEWLFFLGLVIMAMVCILIASEYI